MTRETMKRRRETADTVRKIEAHKMATRKPCETALKQQEHKAFACDFKRYTEMDFLRKVGINVKGNIVNDDGSTHETNTQKQPPDGATN